MEPLSDPQFESMTITLRHNAREVAEAAFAATAATVHINPAGWRCEAVHPGARPGSFDFICPATTDVSVKAAWDLTYALRSLPDIVDAQPSFATYLDELAEEDSPGTASPAPGQLSESRDCQSTDLDYDWSPKLVRAPEAWQVPPRQTTGKSMGEGIIVGHPDAGYIDQDPKVRQAVRKRQAFVLAYPKCPASRAIGALVNKLSPGGALVRQKEGFFKRMVRLFA